nr:hypothetical protein CFP56_52035 [Quercus suber]
MGGIVGEWGFEACCAIPSLTNLIGYDQIEEDQSTIFCGSLYYFWSLQLAPSVGNSKRLRTCLRYSWRTKVKVREGQLVSRGKTPSLSWNVGGIGGGPPVRQEGRIALGVLSGIAS